MLRLGVVTALLSTQTTLVQSKLDQLLKILRSPWVLETTIMTISQNLHKLQAAYTILQVKISFIGMSKAPVSIYPNLEEPFYLDTDASDNRIEAELIHIQNGVEKVIGYCSFMLTPEQRWYCTTCSC